MTFADILLVSFILAAYRKEMLKFVIKLNSLNKYCVFAMDVMICMRLQVYNRILSG